ncbi:hypothetical protein Hanom_Chr00s002869g01706431 [Helianthus anomalus]
MQYTVNNNTSINHKTGNPNHITKQAKLKKVRIISIARSSQNIVSHNMSNGSPSKHINNIEPNRIIRLQQANILLSPFISSLKMSHTILLRQPLFSHILSLEVEEHKPP